MKRTSDGPWQLTQENVRKLFKGGVCVKNLAKMLGTNKEDIEARLRNLLIADERIRR
jgi:hypothetical protein